MLEDEAATQGLFSCTVEPSALGTHSFHQTHLSFQSHSTPVPPLSLPQQLCTEPEANLRVTQVCRCLHGSSVVI